MADDYVNGRVILVTYLISRTGQGSESNVSDLGDRRLGDDRSLQVGAQSENQISLH